MTVTVKKLVIIIASISNSALVSVASDSDSDRTQLQSVMHLQ